jgi:hypothetical protein
VDGSLGKCGVNGELLVPLRLVFATFELVIRVLIFVFLAEYGRMDGHYGYFYGQGYGQREPGPGNFSVHSVWRLVSAAVNQYLCFYEALELVAY